MLMSMMQSNPELLQQMGRTFQQVLIEVQRMEKLTDLKVCIDFYQTDVFLVHSHH